VQGVVTSFQAGVLMAMYLTRELTGATLAEIGHEFGGMQHSTVPHSVRKIEAMCHIDPNLNRAINGLLETRWVVREYCRFSFARQCS
jgi:hypothetical protein